MPYNEADESRDRNYSVPRCRWRKDMVEFFLLCSITHNRKNRLFADTVFGAKVNAMMYFVVDTAKANHVNVRCYLQYLLEEIPKHLNQLENGSFKDMVPWSDAYHSKIG